MISTSQQTQSFRTGWKYERFDLDEKTNDECKADFPFYREDIWHL